MTFSQELRTATDTDRARLLTAPIITDCLAGRVTRDSYEVPIRMPYRTKKPAPAGNGSANTSRPERSNDRGTHKRRQPRATPPLPGTPATRIEPWLNHPCAS